jgi:hypothetical protein
MAGPEKLVMEPKRRMHLWRIKEVRIYFLLDFVEAVVARTLVLANINSHFIWGSNHNKKLSKPWIQNGSLQPCSATNTGFGSISRGKQACLRCRGGL